MTEHRPNVEITITAKNEEDKLIKKFNIYEKISLDPTDVIIQRLANETIRDFKGQADHVVLKALMVLK